MTDNVIDASEEFNRRRSINRWVDVYNALKFPYGHEEAVKAALHIEPNITHHDVHLVSDNTGELWASPHWETEVDPRTGGRKVQDKFITPHEGQVINLDQYRRSKG